MNAPVTTAILLAAGRGSRLRPHTDNTPKPLLPWHNQPTLYWIFGSLRKAGINRVLLVTHYLEQQIQSFAANYAAACEDFTVTTVNQPVLDGTASAVAAGLSQQPDWFEESFLVSATDYLTPESFYSELLSFHSQHHQPLSISLRSIPAREAASRSSVAYTGDFEISQVVEKPPAGTAPSEYCANLIYVLAPQVIPLIHAVKPSIRGECELQSAVNAFLDEGYVARGLLQPAPDEWTADLATGMR